MEANLEEENIINIQIVNYYNLNAIRKIIKKMKLIFVINKI